jgi:hypothetical protein
MLLLAALLLSVELVMFTVELLFAKIAPPTSSTTFPWVRVSPVILKLIPAFTENKRMELPPLNVIKPPPFIWVLLAIVLVVVRLIVSGPPPQLKLTAPPPTNAVFSAPSVQLAGVPVPTVPAANADMGKATWETKSKKTATGEKIFLESFIAGFFLLAEYWIIPTL